MKIHREGYKILTPVLFILLTIAFGIYNLPIPEGVKDTLYTVLFIFFLWMTYFFRFPIRKINYGNHILSTADGVVVAIEEIEETEYFKEKRLQISVFMTGFDVHVNWFPITGIIKYTKHHQGEHFFARHPKSSIHNERSSIVIEKEPGQDILIRQVAGIMARRIVFYCKVGDKVKQGDELGIIRLGSRIDFFLPLDTKVNVKIDQRVVAQQTVIAYFNK